MTSCPKCGEPFTPGVIAGVDGICALCLRGVKPEARTGCAEQDIRQAAQDLVQLLEDWRARKEGELETALAASKLKTPQLDVAASRDATVRLFRKAECAALIGMARWAMEKYDVLDRLRLERAGLEVARMIARAEAEEKVRIAAEQPPALEPNRPAQGPGVVTHIGPNRWERRHPRKLGPGEKV